MTAGQSTDADSAEAEQSAASPQDSETDLYVVYWIDEQGYEGSCEFLRAETHEEARTRSSFGSGGVAHQRLLFDGTFDEFRAYVDEELEDADRFELAWE